MWGLEVGVGSDLLDKEEVDGGDEKRLDVRDPPERLSSFLCGSFVGWGLRRAAVAAGVIVATHRCRLLRRPERRPIGACAYLNPVKPTIAYLHGYQPNSHIQSKRK